MSAAVEPKRKTLTVLGSTGSIGLSTLDVVRQNPELYRVFALSAHSQLEALCAQCIEFSPKYAVVTCADKAILLRALLLNGSSKTEVLSGGLALCEISREPEVDMVMAAIVGAAGLEPTMSAVTSGKRVLLANKESLVMSGGLFTKAVEEHNAKLLPVDSEHNAIFQCLPSDFSSLHSAGVSRLLLTGSGGPFRTLDQELFSSITPEQACAHPNWSMGQKISVDSATMMNKGLELIEACWLFGARVDDVQVLVHPQSIVHSMVQYNDGSVLAQLGSPDMRTPIAHCMAWPERVKSGVEPLDFLTLGSLDFDTPDYERFPCLKLATDVMRDGGHLASVLNAANEVAVASFLAGKLDFVGIPRLVDSVLQSWNGGELDSIDAVIESDQRARAAAQALLV